jgi:Fe-Mn family superoxide dismutase
MKATFLLAMAGMIYLAACGAAWAVGLPPLPYEENALEPVISAKAMGFHYGKHHKTYVDNLNKLIAVSELESLPLEEIINVTAKAKDKDGLAIFNNAAQTWNHTFFWASMKPKGGGKPEGVLLEKINQSFGSYDQFRQAFLDAAVGQFGSGWVWLVVDSGGLKVVKTANADTPVAHGQKALITCDVWEHAYYLDYQNRRKDFVAAFLDSLVNWDFAAAQLAK